MEKKGFYTDIHSHILPGVDDGSPDMETSLRMLQAEAEEGVGNVIFTPHFIPGRKNPDVGHLREVYEEVCAKAAKLLPDMRIYLGNEVYYRGGGVAEALREGKALTLAGTDYVLIEFSVQIDYKGIFQAVRTLTEAGYRPVLAHIERYFCLYKRRDLIDSLTDAGAYTQVNTEDLPGGVFDRRAAFLRSLLEEGRVHFLGSDCHNMDSRKPLMHSALVKLNAGCTDQVARIMTENAKKLLERKWI